MGYKALGFVVWRGARWYLAKKYSGAPRKIALGTIAAGAVAAGIAALAQRQRAE